MMAETVSFVICHIERIKFPQNLFSGPRTGLYGFDIHEKGKKIKNLARAALPIPRNSNWGFGSKFLNDLSGFASCLGFISLFFYNFPVNHPIPDLYVLEIIIGSDHRQGTVIHNFAAHSKNERRNDGDG